MADTTRAEELVQAIEDDEAFRTEIEAAPTIAGKRQALDAHGFGDVSMEEMKSLVESKGGKIVTRSGGRELSEQELAAVAGGLTDAEIGAIAGVSVGTVAVGAGIGFGIAVAAGAI